MGNAQHTGLESKLIMHVFPSFGYGGQQTRLAALANGLGDEFSHFVISLDGDIAAQSLIHDTISIQYKELILKKSSGLSPSNVLKLRALLRDIKPNLLCTYNWGSLESALANRFGLKAPHIHFEDGFGPDESLENQKTRRIIARRAFLSNATVIVPSTKLEDLAKSIWKLKKNTVRRVTNGVDYERFQKPPTQIKQQIVVGSVGALRPEKNYGRLITAFKKADRRHKASLKIIGEGPERAVLVEMINQAQGTTNITLPGATDAPELCYQELDVFALSSDTEQAPLSLMEAMAAGLPVLSTNVGDIASMVSSENRAFITPLGDEEAYATALTHLLDNSDARATLGAANRKKAKEAFSLEQMVEQYQMLFRAKVTGDA